MSLILLNLDSNQQIKLDNQNPLIIGRKNVEGCFDKRVSRNHGRITCTTDGKLRLEALHFNPCFFTRNGVPPVLQLNKDEEETLSEGDYLGLLPNAFWFKITSDKVTKIKIRPDNCENTSIDQGSEENIRTGNLHDNRSATNSKADKTVTTKVKDSSVSNDEVNEGSLNPLPVPTGLSKGFGSEEFEKTRRLPLWMYEIYDPMEANKGSNKRPVPSNSEKEKKQRPLQVSEIDRSSRPDHVTGNGPDITFPSSSTAKPEDKSTAKVLSLKDTESEKVRRPICEEGATCCIQNIHHKAHYCHPGDEDYESQGEQRDSSSQSEGNGKKLSESVEYTRRSGHSQDESVIPPQPLKRSRKRTKVHSDNGYFDEEDDNDEDDADEVILDVSEDNEPSDCLGRDKSRLEDD